MYLTYPVVDFIVIPLSAVLDRIVLIRRRFDHCSSWSHNVWILLLLLFFLKLTTTTLKHLIHWRPWLIYVCVCVLLLYYFFATFDAGRRRLHSRLHTPTPEFCGGRIIATSMPYRFRRRYSNMTWRRSYTVPDVNNAAKTMSRGEPDRSSRCNPRAKKFGFFGFLLLIMQF